MVARTRQMGVPVIADDQEAIVGFDVPRLKQMVARHKTTPGGGLGLRVADAKDGPGAVVGSVREGSAAANAGVLAGDVVEELSGRPVQSAADLERLAASRPLGGMTSILVRRGDERHTFILRG